MAENHSYAYFTSLPLKGSNLTAGGNPWTACRITSPIKVNPKFRKSLEDLDEDGYLAGELHFDKETTISFTIGIRSDFVFPEVNSVVVISADEAPGNRFNGNWQLDSVPENYKPGDRAEVEVTLRYNERLALTP